MMPALVSDVMTVNVVAVRANADFKRIVEVLRWRRVSALPVLDAANKVIGVVSEADLLPHEAYPPRPAAPRRQFRHVPAKSGGLTAAELMTSPAVTVASETTVTEAAQLMETRDIKRLPVVDRDGRLVGIVSRVDLLSVYDRADDDICNEITEQVLAGDFVFDPHEFAVTVSDGVVTIAGRLESHNVALSLLQAIWEVAGVVDVRDRLSYPVTR